MATGINSTLDGGGHAFRRFWMRGPVGWLGAMAATVMAYGQPSLAPAGSIAGRVVLEESGQPVGGATVTVFARERPPVMSGEWVTIGQTAAAGDGSYTFNGLPQREYLLCAAAPSTAAADLLPGCSWGRRPHVVLVRPGTAVTGQDIAIERGRLLEVEADDPADHLDKNELPGRGVYLLVGVWGPDGDFHGARLSQKAKGSRRYEVLVPFDTDLRLEVRGHKLDVDDDKGKAKQASDAPEAFREARSASRAAKKVVIKVKGVKP